MATQQALHAVEVTVMILLTFLNFQLGLSFKLIASLYKSQKYLDLMVILTDFVTQQSLFLGYSVMQWFPTGVPRHPGVPFAVPRDAAG